jgi:hypothetical protein
MCRPHRRRPPIERIQFRPAAVATEYPKTLLHPVYSVGRATGLLMKDYRGKDTNFTVPVF